MTLKQKIHERIEALSDAQLEWLDHVLLESDAEVERKPRLLEEFAAPMPEDDIIAFKEAVARRPWRSEANQ